MISLILIFGCLCRSYSTGFPNPSDREIYYSDVLYQRMREKNIAPQLTAVVQNNAVSRGVWVNVQATICFSQGIWNINDGQISRLVNVDNWDSRKPQNGEVWISRDECAKLIVRNWSERDMVTFFLSTVRMLSKVKVVMMTMYVWEDDVFVGNLRDEK